MPIFPFIPKHPEVGAAFLEKVKPRSRKLWDILKDTGRKVRDALGQTVLLPVDVAGAALTSGVNAVANISMAPGVVGLMVGSAIDKSRTKLRNLFGGNVPSESEAPAHGAHGEAHAPAGHH